MYLVVHASVGAALGGAMPATWMAAPVGFLSHFVLDIIPHGDGVVGRVLLRKENRLALVALALLDAIAALCIVVLLWLLGFIQSPEGAVLGAVAAMLPDILSGFTALSHGTFLKDFDEFHGWNHQLLGVEAPILVGAALQGIVFTLATLFQVASPWFTRLA